MLNYYNCLRLLSELASANLVTRDPEDRNRILVYREAGSEDPEGWYSESIFDAARELQADEEGQKYLLDALRDLAGKTFQVVDLQ